MRLGQVVESFGALCPYDCFKPCRQYCLGMEESREHWRLNSGLSRLHKMKGSPGSMTLISELNSWTTWHSTTISMER